MKKNMADLMAKMTQMGKSSQAYKLKTSSLEVNFTSKGKQVHEEGNNKFLKTNLTAGMGKEGHAQA
jgi:hypothetical protein